MGKVLRSLEDGAPEDWEALDLDLACKDLEEDGRAAAAAWAEGAISRGASSLPTLARTEVRFSPEMELGPRV